MKKHIFIFTIPIILFAGCDKIQWDLPKSNPYDVDNSNGSITQNGNLIGSNNCSSLTGFSTYYSGINGASGNWGIGGNGYAGSCLMAPPTSSTGNLSITSGTHYVSFTRSFSNSGYIEFWANSYNPGSNNIIPTISINNGPGVFASVIGGQTSSFNFIQLRSQLIPAGNNTIKIQFNGSNSIFKIDEISFFEYN